MKRSYNLTEDEIAEACILYVFDHDGIDLEQKKEYVVDFNYELTGDDRFGTEERNLKSITVRQKDKQ